MPILAGLDASVPTIEMLETAAGAWVDAQLTSVAPIDLNERNQLPCADEGFAAELQCSEEYAFALVEYSFSVLRVVPFGLQQAPKLGRGDTVTLQIPVGIVGSGNPEYDALTTKARDGVLSGAPIGSRFIVFLRLQGQETVFATWMPWATVDANGELHSLYVNEFGRPADVKDWTAELPRLADLEAASR